MAVYVQGLGTPRVIIFLLPEAGDDVEACVRGPDTLKWLRFQKIRLSERVVAEVVEQRQKFTPHCCLLSSYPPPYGPLFQP